MPIGEARRRAIEKVFARQGPDGQWTDGKRRPGFEVYLPKYKATLWALVTLADLKCPPDDERAGRALQAVFDLNFRPAAGVFGWSESAYGSHEPSPCFNGNIIYVAAYFGRALAPEIESTLQTFARFQRFDDGDFRTPLEFPYSGDRDACYSSHTCYWGVCRLLKGISFIPRPSRTRYTQRLLERCVDFVLLHRVCFSSHRPEDIIGKWIDRLTFPNMYSSDYLELLWLLKREGVRDPRIGPALQLLESARNPDGTWNLERPVNNLVYFGGKDRPNAFVTERALEVLG